MTEFHDPRPYKWKTVRVFISSTFRDFHAERDYLIKYVFPELRQWCEKYKLHLIDIDLRWGVTEKEAETGKVIELCLEQIDGCRPFFICMLGSRYGWIPNKIDRSKVNKETLKNFPALREKWKNLSVTHLEIMHAALSPLHGKEPVPHSFFYFRDKKSLPGENELKGYSAEQRKEYTKTFLEEEPQKTEKLNDLKNDIEGYFEKDKDRRIFPYTPKFDTSLSNPEDDNLKGRFTAESLSTFGIKVKEHLLHALEIQFTGRIQYLSKKREENSLENERDFHEAFIENRTTLFIGRTKLLQRLHDYVNSDSNKILAVYGESGSGKSALLAKFYREFKYDVDGNEINQEVLFIPHFIGASPSSSAKQSMLRRFCEELKDKFNYEDEIPYDPNKLMLTFKDFLEKSKSKVIILIDGLNQLDETDRAQELDWLPYELPEHVKIIASTLEGKAKDSLKGLTNEHLEVGELNKGERREIIREMPSVFAKTLEEKHIKVLLKKKATRNPLYLKVALEELRLFGSFEKLGKKVRILPDTVIDMFVDVIERLEKEGDKKLVERLFCVLECSRYGLTENELEELLDDNKKDHIIILRQLRDYFISRDRLIDFFHRGLSKAVRRKYNLENEVIKWHIILAEYFAKQPHFLDGDKQKKPNVRKCIEQPWQETKGAMWDEVTETLCDLDFIQAKSTAKHTYDLVNDYNVALTVIPDNAENIRKEKERQARLDKYAKDMVLYAKGEIKKIEVPKSITPWSEEKTNAEIARIKTNPSRADRLKDFYNFLGHEVGNLQNHAKEIAHLATQQAWNYADSGPVGEAAGKKPNEVLKRLLLRTAPTRPFHNPLPQALKTLKGHNDSVYAVAISPDGQMALSGSKNGTCILWNMESGMLIKTLIGHTKGVRAVAITPDGKMALSSSEDDTCILWDLESGMPRKTLKKHAYSVAITPDGKIALSGTPYWTCILWDLESGMPLKTLKGHNESVYAVAITSDGKIGLSGSEDKTCILWDLESGIPLKTLKGHTQLVQTVAITPDGKMALSGSKDGTCILWNLESSIPPKTLKGHTQLVETVAITPDGKMALSGSRDGTCILWNLERGQPVKTIKEHTTLVTAVAITADGKMALSGLYDNTCILMDLESGMPRKTYKGHTGSIYLKAITLDGKMAIYSSSDYTCILRDLENGMHLKALEGHTNIVTDVAVTPDGKMALSSSRDGTCILWNLESGQPVKTLQPIKFWGGSGSPVTAIAITPDGKMALSGISQGGTCILLDLESGQPVKTLKPIETFKIGYSPNTAMAITPDGKMALSGFRNACYLWNLSGGMHLKTLKGHTKDVNVVAITPDGKMAVSGSWDSTSIMGSCDSTCTCILWNLESGLPLKTLKGHTDSVSTVAITPDGKMAFSGSRDGTCILWDLKSGEKRAQFFSIPGDFTIKLFPWRIFVAHSGETFILHAHRELLCPGIGIITARRIWDFEFKQYQPFSADCPFCGIRFSPPKSVLDTIEEITKNAGLLPEQSPCLELSKEVWEEPGLLSECPQCGEDLKFNPFIVNNKGRNSFEHKEKDFPKLEPKPKKKDPLDYFNQGNEFYDAKKYNIAVQSYKQAIQIKPDYEMAYYFLGLANKALGNLDEAKGAFKQAIQLKEDDKDSHFNIGLVYAELDSSAEAKYHLKRALDLGHEQALAALESIPSRERTKPITNPKLKISRLENHFNKAHILLDKGKIKLAVFLFKEAIPLESDADPSSYLPNAYHNPGYVHFCRGLQYERNSNIAEAEYHFLLAIQLGNKPAEAVVEWLRENEGFPKPKSKEKNRVTLFNQAVGFQNDKKYEEAIKAFKEFIELKPNYALAYYFLGECYGEMGQSAKAIHAFKEALYIEEQDQWTHYKLGIEYKKEGSNSEAKFHLRRALDLGMEEARSELESLKEDLNLKANSDIGKKLERYEVLFKLGKSYAIEGDFEGAILAFKEVIQLKPEFKLPYYHLGLAFHSLTKISEAKEAFKEALRLEVNKKETHFYLGQLYQKEDSIAEAKYHYKKARFLGEAKAKISLEKLRNIEEKKLASEPKIIKKDHLISYNLGVKHLSEKKYKQAITAFKECLQINPNFEKAYNNLGMVFKKSGQLDEAINAYKKAIKINPNYGNALFNLGLAYLAAGRIDEAIQSYQEVIRLDPKDYNAYLNLGLFYEEVPNLEKAAEAYQEAIKLNPDFLKAYNSMGGLYFKKGELALAKEFFIKSLQKEKNQSHVHFNLGLVYKKSGNLPEAKTHFECAQELGFERARYLLDTLNIQEKKKSKLGPAFHILSGHSSKITSLALSSDGRFAVSGSADQAVSIWSLPWRKRLHSLTGCGNEVLSVAIYENPNQLVFCTRDGSIKVSSLEGENLRELGHFPGLKKATFCKDSQNMIHVDHKNFVSSLNLVSGKSVAQFQGGPGTISDIAFSEKAKLVVIGYHENHLAIWLSESKMKIHDLKTLSSVTAVSISPSGLLTIYACKAGVLVVLDSLSGLMKYSLVGHTQKVNALACSENGKRLLSASDDGTMRVWNLEDGSLMECIEIGSNLTACQIASNGLHVIAGDKSGNLYYRQPKDISLLNKKSMHPMDMKEENSRDWWKFWKN